MIKKTFRVAKKLFRLGPLRLQDVARARIRAFLFISRARARVRKGIAHHSWQSISQTHGDVPFESFFNVMRKQNFSWLRNWYSSEDISDDAIIARADAYVQGRKQSDDKQNLLFFADISIKAHHGPEGGYDIRQTWELARFTDAWMLGRVYELSRDTRYRDALQEDIHVWIQQNPYLMGVHWVCPMEVALRSINWVIAASFLIDEEKNDSVWWQQFIGSLYDHYEYLWYMHEVFDSRTNNHYISDLVGGLYLCFIFAPFHESKKRARWFHAELLKELEKQVFPEGSSYEGSTAYHELVTELVHCACAVSEALGLPFERLRELLEKMSIFVSWTHGLTIGDDDSSKIISAGLPQYLINRDVHGTAHFPAFGISLIKTDRVHFSLRHHVYRWQQPSGHFHNDVGSITLSLDNQPIFVDPGSYIYTGSVQWRNHFRSAAMHNAFYIQGTEPVILGDLFSLALSENSVLSKNMGDEHNVYMQHALYDQFGLTAHRKILVEEDIITITDWWEGDRAQDVPTLWNFTLAPDVRAELDDNRVLFFYDNKCLAVMSSSDLKFSVQEGWMSQHYGNKVATQCLQVKKTMRVTEPLNTEIRIMR